jgi:hypothetical protein
MTGSIVGSCSCDEQQAVSFSVHCMCMHYYYPINSVIPHARLARITRHYLAYSNDSIALHYIYVYNSVQYTHVTTSLKATTLNNTTILVH